MQVYCQQTYQSSSLLFNCNQEPSKLLQWLGWKENNKKRTFCLKWDFKTRWVHYLDWSYSDEILLSHCNVISSLKQDRLKQGAGQEQRKRTRVLRVISILKIILNGIWQTESPETWKDQSQNRRILLSATKFTLAY